MKTQKMRRINVKQIESEKFAKLYDWLFEEPYRQLSNDTRVAYCLLKNRHGLSVQNGWFDSDGDVFLIYTRKELAEVLGVSLNKMTRIFKSLVECGLIEDIQQGLNRANRIYILEPVVKQGTERTLQNEVSGESGDDKMQCQQATKCRTNKINSNKTEKEDEDEERASEFKTRNEALLFAKSFLELRIKNNDRFDLIMTIIETFIEDIKSLRVSSIKAYCLKILMEHDQPAPEVAVKNVAKPAKSRSKSASRTETIIEYDNEPVVRTPEEEAFELERIKNLMKDLK